MTSVVELAERVRQGELSASALVDEALRRVALHNDGLGAFVHIDAASAREAAAEVDRKCASGDDPGPLAGVPIGVKDTEACRGMPLTHGSLLKLDDPPQRADSLHLARLRAAGAVPIGMTAVPEFATIAFTRTKAHGTARNPWQRAATPGGSSGGSASAVAAGLVPLATADDGGGSTRIPASFSGLVGFKASYGRIPRAEPRTAQTAVIGALATSVTDAARHLDVAAGPDDRDRTSLPACGLRYEAAIEALDVAGLRVAYSPDLGFAVVDPEVAQTCAAAADRLVAAAALNRRRIEIELSAPYSLWSGIELIDFWQNLDEGDWPDRKAAILGHNRANFERSEHFPAAKYAKIAARRNELEAAVAAVFEQVDVLITPTTAAPAFAADGPPPAEIAGQAVDPSMVVPFTMLANLCWNPAISVPAGTSADGRPIGLQIIGRRHADEVVLRLARIFEQAAPWPRVAPDYEEFSL